MSAAQNCSALYKCFEKSSGWYLYFAADELLEGVVKLSTPPSLCISASTLVDAAPPPPLWLFATEIFQLDIWVFVLLPLPSPIVSFRLSDLSACSQLFY